MPKAPWKELNPLSQSHLLKLGGAFQRSFLNAISPRENPLPHGFGYCLDQIKLLCQRKIKERHYFEKHCYFKEAPCKMMLLSVGLWVQPHLIDVLPAKPGKRSWVSEAVEKWSATQKPSRVEVSFPGGDQNRRFEQGDLPAWYIQADLIYKLETRRLCCGEPHCRKRVGKCGGWQDLAHWCHPPRGKTTTGLKTNHCQGEKKKNRGIYTKEELCKIWEIIAAALLDARETSVVAVVSVSVLKDKNYRPSELAEPQKGPLGKQHIVRFFKLGEKVTCRDKCLVLSRMSDLCHV